VLHGICCLKATHSKTRHPEHASRDALGRGFKPEVKPLSGILQRLASRQQELISRCARTHTPAGVGGTR
jgi:hypothetical protein